MRDRWMNRPCGQLRGTVILALVLALPALAGGAQQGGTECEGPTDLVEVTVEAGEHGLFRYTVHNRHVRSLRIFILGRNERTEMQIMPENIPQRVHSPAGWEGQYIFLHESEYMQIFWLASAREHWLASGSSLSGFDLVMPERRAERPELFTASGEKSTPLDMTRAPFHVLFEGGKCVWGRVREQRSEDSTPP